LPTSVHTPVQAGVASAAHDLAPKLAAGRLARPWRLDDGLFTADPAPPAAHLAHTRAQALAADRSSDLQFFGRAALVGAPSGHASDLGAARALVTLHGLRPVCIEVCKPPLPQPTAPVYNRRPAWIVWYRITGGTTGCPAAGTSPAAPPPSTSASHVGWIVFIYPDHLDGALTFHESYDLCAPAPATLDLAVEHIGVAWKLVARHGRLVTVTLAPPPCSSSSFSEAGTDDGRHATISIVYAAPFGTNHCPRAARHLFKASIPPSVTLIRSGPVGLLG
jgi:membrane-associated phospholipid phosphatase